MIYLICEQSVTLFTISDEIKQLAEEVSRQHTKSPRSWELHSSLQPNQEEAQGKEGQVRRCQSHAPR